VHARAAGSAPRPARPHTPGVSDRNRPVQPIKPAHHHKMGPIEGPATGSPHSPNHHAPPLAAHTLQDAAHGRAATRGGRAPGAPALPVPSSLPAAGLGVMGGAPAPPAPAALGLFGPAGAGSVEVLGAWPVGLVQLPPMAECTRGRKAEVEVSEQAEERGELGRIPGYPGRVGSFTPTPTFCVCGGRCCEAPQGSNHSAPAYQACGPQL
jgi:hypothetical protein